MTVTLSVPPKGAATIFVAASNASVRSQNHADFVCSGAGDQATIASAVAALPTGGGTIVLSEGTFTFSAHYALVSSNITFQGQGVSTIIQCSTSDFIFSQSSTPFNNISFESILFLGTVNQTVSVPTQARTTSGAGTTIAIWIDGSLDTSGSNPAISNISIHKCAFRNISSLPVRLFGIGGVTRVTNCEFTNTKDVGFAFNAEVICSNNHSYMSADNGFSISRSNTKITCTGNTAELSCFDGIWLSGFIVNSNSLDYGPTDFTCVGNTIKNVGQNGIRLEDAPMYGVIAGNTIDQGYNRGPVDATTDIQCNGIAVRGYPSNAPASPTFYAKQLLIANNVIRTAPRAGIYLNGVQGVKVIGNEFYDIGTQFYADGTTSIGTNLGAMANPQDIGIFIDQVTTVKDVTIEHNRCIDQRGTPYAIQFMYPAPPISGVTVNGNTQNGCRLGPMMPTDVRSDVMGTSTLGAETMPRWAASNSTNITLSNGTLRLAYFRARRHDSVSHIRITCGSTAAGATPTLVRFGLYSVDASGNLTLLQGSTNDTSALNSTLTDTTEAITATALVEGQSYAIGAIVMTGAAAPTVMGVLCSSGGNNGNDPRLCGIWTGQTDLPSSITAGSVSNSQSFFYAQVY